MLEWMLEGRPQADRICMHGLAIYDGRRVSGCGKPY
jgi:hypothetical protein